MSDKFSHLDRLINTIRYMLAKDFSEDRIYKNLTEDGYAEGDIFLAYQAAGMLEEDDEFTSEKTDPAIGLPILPPM